MFKTYFKTALRSLGKQKLYSIINIFGLTVGLSACLLIGVYIIHELNYDRFHANADRIVRVTMETTGEGSKDAVATTGTKVGPQFKRVFPEVKQYVRTYLSQSNIKTGDHYFEAQHILYADDQFFNIFSFHLLEGNPATALDAPDKVVITRSVAERYFGKDNGLNKTLTFGGKERRVSGVCEDAPQDSQIKFDMVTPFSNLGSNAEGETWWTANWITYLLLRDEKNLPRLQQQINSYMQTPAVRTDAGLESGSTLNYRLEPLTAVHLYSTLSGLEPNGSITYVYMFAVIALLILFTACANYINLATVQSAGRSGEIGIRKVMGASRSQVFIQFIGESFFITAIAALCAFGLSMLMIPYFNNIAGKHFTADVFLHPLPVLLLLFCAILASFLAGLYPALVLSGMQVIGVLKKGFTFTGNNNLLRRTLIVLQFGISVFLAIYTVIILQQMNYAQTKKLGYDKDHVVVLPIGSAMLKNFGNIKNALLNVPGVEGVTASYETPEFIEWGDVIHVTDESGKHKTSLTALPVDLDFVKTMKMELIAGRDFQQSDFALMDTSNDNRNFHSSYLINETLAKKIGWSPTQAINKMLERRTPGAVVGVVKDFNFSSLHDPIGPLLIFLDRDFSQDFLVRINGNSIPATLGKLEKMWKQRVPERPFTYHFLDDDYNRLYLTETRTSYLFFATASLAILLACMGLFGLAAYTTVQRTKEIGIRRILGAGVSSITFMIAKGFLQLVGIAILIAAPLAWWVSNRWLQDFAYRISIPLSVFLATATITVLIAVCTVGYHSIKVSLTNPVKNLRTE